MNRNSIGLALISAIVFFVAGFAFANFLNRSEMNDLRGENERLKTNQTTSADGINLTNEEIDAKLVEAEQNASNFTFQKNLGLGLYRYGVMKQDKDLIGKSLPVLLRAHGLDKADYDVIVGLGHAYYDVGFYGKDNGSFEKAREYYNKALAIKKDDIEIRTDLGMTYFLQAPPDYPTAIAEFERSLAVNPKHEKTLQFAALAMKNQNKDFSKYSEVLRSVNPGNPVLRELASPPSLQQ